MPNAAVPRPAELRNTAIYFHPANATCLEAWDGHVLADLAVCNDGATYTAGEQCRLIDKQASYNSSAFDGSMLLLQFQVIFPWRVHLPQGSFDSKKGQ